MLRRAGKRRVWKNPRVQLTLSRGSGAGHLVPAEEIYGTPSLYLRALSRREWPRCRIPISPYSRFRLSLASGPLLLGLEKVYQPLEGDYESQEHRARCLNASDDPQDDLFDGGAFEWDSFLGGHPQILENTPGGAESTLNDMLRVAFPVVMNCDRIA